MYKSLFGEDKNGIYKIKDNNKTNQIKQLRVNKIICFSKYGNRLGFILTKIK